MQGTYPKGLQKKGSRQTRERKCLLELLPSTLLGRRARRSGKLQHFQSGGRNSRTSNPNSHQDEWLKDPDGTGHWSDPVCDVRRNVERGVSNHNTPTIERETVNLLREPLTVLSKAMVDVEYEGQTERLPLQIIKGSGPSLFGRNWLSKIRVIWPTIKKISNELDSVLDKRPEVSKDELGTLKGAKAQFFVEPGAVPKFHKLRPVPHAIKRAIEQELDRLENMGVLEKVRFSN